MSDPDSIDIRTLDIQILGPFEFLNADGKPVSVRGRQRRLLLAFLLQPGRPLTLSALAEIVCGQGLSPDAEDRVRLAIFRLRRTLAKHGIPRDLIATCSPGAASGHGGYYADLPAGALDLDRFLTLAGRAGQAKQAGDAEGAAELFCQALGCWRDPHWKFPDAPELPAFQGIIGGLDGQRRQAEEQLVRIKFDLGKHAEILPFLQARWQEDLTNEVVCAYVMEALAAVGRAAEADRAYWRARTALIESGLSPSPQLTEAHARILRANR